MLTIGVDVGGTGIKSALIKVGDVKCADTYEILDFSSMPTQASEGSEVVVRNIIKSIERYDWQKCDLIAVASAGTIDWDRLRLRQPQFRDTPERNFHAFSQNISEDA